MNVMRRRLLRLAGVGAATVALSKLAFAFDSETGAELQLAMGPTSAAQTPGGTGAPPDPNRHTMHISWQALP